jgi:hypothetical protein
LLSKEGLVGRVRDWPGVHAVRALLQDEPLEGLWFDRTQEYGARRRGEEFARDRFATRETVVLSPLPCWEHLSPEERKEKIAELVLEIETEAAEQREKTGKEPLGRVGVLKQHPHERPMRSKRSYAPLVHAVSQKVRRDLYDGYRAFVAAFPGGGGEAEDWQPGRGLPRWELPARLAVRRRLTTAGDHLA